MRCWMTRWCVCMQRWWVRRYSATCRRWCCAYTKAPKTIAKCWQASVNSFDSTLSRSRWRHDSSSPISTHVLTPTASTWTAYERAVADPKILKRGRKTINQPRRHLSFYPGKGGFLKKILSPHRPCPPLNLPLWERAPCRLYFQGMTTLDRLQNHCSSVCG